jgi:hypothetical protein
MMLWFVTHQPKACDTTNMSFNGPSIKLSSIVLPDLNHVSYPGPEHNQTGEPFHKVVSNFKIVNLRQRITLISPKFISNDVCEIFLALVPWQWV